MMLYVNGEPVLTIGKGHALFTTDNTYDIGASGATRPRSIYFGTSIVAPDGGTIGQAAGPLLTFDDTNNFLEITGCWVSIGTATPLVALHVVGLDGSDGYGYIDRYSNVAATTPGLSLRRAKGTLASPTVVVADDIVGQVAFTGLVSGTTTFKTFALIKAEVDGAIGLNDVPGRLVFSTTPDGSETITERFRITQEGVLSSGGIDPANVTAAGAMIAGGGIAFSDVANAHIDDASHGTGTVTHYIGNAAILTGNGVSFGPAGVTSITVVNGQITAIS